MRYCFYHTDLGQNAVFENFATNLHSVNIQDDRSTRGLFKPLKQFPKSHIWPAGSHFCSASCSECLNETRVNLQHNKEIIMFIHFH